MPREYKKSMGRVTPIHARCLPSKQITSRSARRCQRPGASSVHEKTVIAIFESEGCRRNSITMYVIIFHFSTTSVETLYTERQSLYVSELRTSTRGGNAITITIFEKYLAMIMDDVVCTALLDSILWMMCDSKCKARYSL